MAAIGAVLGSLRGGSLYLKPCKKSIFGDFECRLKLHKSHVTPDEDIEGTVEIETTREIQHHGLRVQLEAILDLRYDTKIDNRVSSHRKVENLIEGSSELKEGYYIFSPVMQQLLGVPDEDDKSAGDLNFTVSPGSQSYPFKFAMTGENLPAPFRNQYGTLQFKVAAYIRAYHCYVTLSEKPLRFRGHCDLNEVPSFLEPLTSETGFFKSLFSSKKSITAIFEVFKKGFLPGEDATFQIKVVNPKAYVVKHFSVQLTRRINYNIDGATKNTSSNLNRFGMLEVSRDEEIKWKGKVGIPANCVPSYCVKPIYHVTYHLEYEVKVAEYPRPLKGQVEIVIGTTRENDNDLMTQKMNALQIPDHPVGRRERSQSVVSSLSDSSLMSTATQPPNYSQLSSRASSRLSLATLPPHYDDLA